MDQPPPSQPPDQPPHAPPLAQPPPVPTSPQGGFAPPTQPFAHTAAPPKAPTWVRAIGIIAIILGSLSVAGGLCGAAMPIVINPFLQKVGNVTGTDSSADWMEKWQTTIVLGSIIGAALGIFLIVSASKLLKCKHEARKLLMTWACADLAYIVVNAVMQFGMQADQLEEMRKASSNSPAAAGLKAGYYGGMIGGVIGIIWGLAPPIFALIWFSRAKIKAEVAQWT